MASQWYYANDDQKCGPVTSTELKQLAASGDIRRDTMLWKSGMTDWVEAETVQGLFPPTEAVPPPIPSVRKSDHRDASPERKRNRWVIIGVLFCCAFVASVVILISVMAFVSQLESDEERVARVGFRKLIEQAKLFVKEWPSQSERLQEINDEMAASYAALPKMTSESYLKEQQDRVSAIGTRITLACMSLTNKKYEQQVAEVFKQLSPKEKKQIEQKEADAIAAQKSADEDFRWISNAIEKFERDFPQK